MPADTEKITIFQNPENPIAMDIHMWVGGDNYTVREFVMESREQGMSKRIPLTTIPEGIVPGVSCLFVSHKKAILKVTAEGKTLIDLLQALFEAGTFTASQVEELSVPALDEPYWIDTGILLQPGDFVPEQMLTLVMGLDAIDKKIKKQLIDEFAIEFYPGVFGMGYLTGIDYICKKDEETLPEELEHLEGYVTPVKVKYDNE